jgi:hypothetical protein
MRPLFAHAVTEPEALMAERAMRHLRKDGWLKLYRTTGRFAATSVSAICGRAQADPSGAERRRDPCAEYVARAGVPARRTGRRPPACRILAVTKAYASQFTLLGGITLKGDARTLHCSGDGLAGRHRGRSTDARTRWWRSGRGRQMCSVRSASGCRRLQARLSPALSSARQRRSDAAGRRHRRWLLSGADGQGIRTPRRRIRRPRRRGRRCRSTAAAGDAGVVPTSATDRAPALDGLAAVLRITRPVIGRAPGSPACGSTHACSPLGPDARPSGQRPAVDSRRK